MERKIAFDAAQSLCKKLEEEKNNFFSHQDFVLFKKNCLTHIKEGRLILDKHREYDKRIMNALAIVFSCGIYGIIILFDRLFKCNATFFLTATDSSLRVNKIEESFDEAKLIKSSL